jgi:hypothetical protein
MKIQTSSVMPILLRTALGLASLLSLSVLVGCTTNRAPQKETLSNQEFRFLYPRQYYESASPLERQELDRQEQEKAWEERNTR